MGRKVAVLALVVLLVAAFPLQATQSKTFELDFRDAPLSAVLQTLARAAGVNLVVEGELLGRVTLHLNRLTFDQALRLLAATYRLTYVFRDGTYVVKQLPPPQGEIIIPGGAVLPIEMRAYRLQYANAEELAVTLQKVLQAFTGSGTGSEQMPTPSQGTGATLAPQTPPPVPSSGGTSGSGSGTQQPVPPTSTGTQQPGPSSFPQIPQSASQPSAAQGQAGGIAVVADPASNSLLVAAPVAIHLQLQQVLRAIDTPGAARKPEVRAETPGGTGTVEQVGPSTISVQVRHADLDALGKLISSEVSGVAVNADSRSRKLLITGSTRQREQALRLVELLDKPVPQVMMSTRVVELNENASRKLGIQWDWSPQVTMTQVEGGIQFGSSPPGLLDMVGKIVAAVEEGQGRVLANPQVAVQDGKKGAINVGQTLYIPIVQTQNGQTTTTLQTINAGIKLEFTPRIIDEKKLVSELNIEVNSLAGFGPGNMPIINSRAVNTTLEVTDGTPIVIGGLISDTTTELLKKIPILGDIPLIGEIFRYRETTRNYSNIVIIIVPRILMPAESKGG